MEQLWEKAGLESDYGPSQDRPPPTSIVEAPVRNWIQCNPEATGGCWDAYIAQGHSNYTCATADYVEPHIGSTVCTGPLAEVLWVGLGGWNGFSNVLGQDGTGYGEGDPHGPWFEVLPGAPIYPVSWQVVALLSHH